MTLEEAIFIDDLIITLYNFHKKSTAGTITLKSAVRTDDWGNLFLQVQKKYKGFSHDFNKSFFDNKTDGIRELLIYKKIITLNGSYYRLTEKGKVFIKYEGGFTKRVNTKIEEDKNKKRQKIKDWILMVIPVISLVATILIHYFKTETQTIEVKYPDLVVPEKNHTLNTVQDSILEPLEKMNKNQSQ